MAYPKFLSVQTHGGRCCGIKTIWNFPHNPEEYVQVIEKRRFNGTVDYYGKRVEKSFDFMTDERPMEKAGDRLKAIIEFIKKKRPAGLIEITLTDYQAHHWSAFIKKLGFKPVTKFRNSNTSGTIITVYHLAYDEKGY